MTEQEDPENEFENRGRAIWPGEPSEKSQFEKPGRASSYDEVWLNGPPPDEFPFDQMAPTFEHDDPPSLEPPFVPVEYVPETPEETVRQSGLAYSAGIVFFFSVAFMLLLGWGADLLLGSSPWGLVVGIVLGSIIGFLQFFRITSQIFNKKKIGPATRPLMPRDDDDK